MSQTGPRDADGVGGGDCVNPLLYRPGLCSNGKIERGDRLRERDGQKAGEREREREGIEVQREE